MAFERFELSGGLLFVAGGVRQQSQQAPVRFIIDTGAAGSAIDVNLITPDFSRPSKFAEICGGYSMQSWTKLSKLIREGELRAWQRLEAGWPAVTVFKPGSRLTIFNPPGRSGGVRTSPLAFSIPSACSRRCRFAGLPSL